MVCEWNSLENFNKTDLEATIAGEKKDIKKPYIIGASVVTEDGESVGTLEDILETPASQIYVVKGETEHLIPAVDEFIVKVDAENAVVTVRLIEGM